MSNNSLCDYYNRAGNMREVTNADWEVIEERFGKLFNYASWRTPRMGYLAREDKVSLMKEVTLHAIRKYTPEIGKSDKVSDFITTNHFAKYLKCCIWYERSRVTKETYKKAPTDGHNIQLSALTEDYVESELVVSSDGELKDVELNGELKDFALFVMADMSNFKKNGNINVMKVSRELQIPPSKTRSNIERLKTVISLQIED